MKTLASGTVVNTAKANRILVLLFIINLFNYLDRFVLASVLEPVKADLKIVDDGDLGRLATAFLFGYFLSSPFFGYLGDRFPRKYLMVFGIVGWSVGACLTAFAQDYRFMLVCRVIVGLGEASFSAIGPAVISDTFPKEKRNSAMTFYLLAVPVGAALGYLLGGLISASSGWRSAFLWTGLPGFFLALLLLFFPMAKKGESDGFVHAAQASVFQDIKALAFNKQYLVAVSGFVFHTFATGAFSFWGPTFLTRVHHLTQKQATGFFGPMLIAVGIFATFAGGRIASAWQ
ncbi:MFS transporter, partial [bacterium]|nr:MFS transporter [bacterium]